MSLIYRTGRNRLWYKAKGFATGKLVTGTIVTPELKEPPTLIFTEYGSGHYYHDFEFEMPGTHLGIFLEDGENTRSAVFRVLSTKGQFVFTGDYRV